MRLIGGFAALAALASSAAANAQAANQAFECGLPYRAAMEAMATLKVTGQSRHDGIAILSQGPYEVVEFAPDTVQVFGQKPATLSLTVEEPLPDDDEKLYSMTFEATFPADAIASDEAIIAANTWHISICGEGSTLCIRADSAEPEGFGEMYYYRYRGEPFKLQCRFKFTEQDLDALGA
jgi:hypothetical protein